jgi:hypothetical protein
MPKHGWLVRSKVSTLKMENDEEIEFHEIETV